MLDFTKETSYRSNESENALHVFKSILKKKYSEFYEFGVKLLCNKAHCQMTVTDTTKSLRKKKNYLQIKRILTAKFILVIIKNF